MAGALVRAALLAVGLWCVVSEESSMENTKPQYNSSTWGKLIKFSEATNGDTTSDVTLRCSACSIFATKIQTEGFENPTIYKEFKNWDRQTRIAKLRKFFLRGCNAVRGMKITQHGNMSERIWEDLDLLIAKGGTRSTMTMMPASAGKLAAICDNYLEEDVPDMVDRMSTYIGVVVGKNPDGTFRKQRVIDFKLREEICIEQFKLCGLHDPSKHANPNAAKVEDDMWDEVDEREAWEIELDEMEAEKDDDKEEL